ncbi:MAG: hypothetical protein JW829_01025 [Pirellulales bacterium]|nr:hypothetical protein [Pirellulales bacterium]
MRTSDYRNPVFLSKQKLVGGADDRRPIGLLGSLSPVLGLGALPDSLARPYAWHWQYSTLALSSDGIGFDSLRNGGICSALIGVRYIVVWIVLRKPALSKWIDQPAPHPS